MNVAPDTPWRLLQLPAELIERIVGSIPGNEVPCTLRLVNRGAAEHFREPHHLQIYLSAPVPHHNFCQHWGNPAALRGLTLQQRRDLLCLTAQAGVVSNLSFIVPRVGIVLSGDVFVAAAKSGQLESCRWLRAHGCPCGMKAVQTAAAAAGHLHILQWLWGPHCRLTSTALTAAARHGHVHVCEWLLSCGCPWSKKAPGAAAYGGHVDLMYVLLDEQPSDVDYNGLLVAAAAGCDLPTLQGLLHVVLEERRRNWELPAYTETGMLAAAYASATPDWRAKVEWLQEQGYEPADGAAHLQLDWDMIASGRDPMGRWEALGFRWPSDDSEHQIDAAAVAFAAVGNVEALRALYGSVNAAAPAETLSATVGPMAAPAPLAIPNDAAAAAAGAGQLPALQLLLSLCATYVLHSGVENDLELEVRHESMVSAACNGHLHIVSWLATCRTSRDGLANADLLGAGATLASSAARLLDEEVFAAAAESGSLELMAWLRQHGCVWGPGVFAAAAGAGSAAALEWLARQGCPMGDTGEPYVRAARNGDMATLRALRRVGCPWGPAGDGGAAAHKGDLMCRVIWELNRRRSAVPVLRCLLSEGCPVDWAAASRVLPVSSTETLRAWVRQERRRHRREQRARGGRVASLRG